MILMRGVMFLGPIVARLGLNGGRRSYKRENVDAKERSGPRWRDMK